MWGGKSLYPASSSGPPTVSGGPAAVTVSFDRPYAQARGAGLMLRWEYPFVRWLEAQAVDVSYATDIDLERDPSIADGRRLVIFVGHPEYWSAPMRATLTNAIAHGTNVAFFSADELYWRVRFDASYRSITCYRRADLDPITATQPWAATVQWGSASPADAPSRVVGLAYGHIVAAPADYVVVSPDNWIYRGTGLRAGDRLKALVGQEYDTYTGTNVPPGVSIVARSPVRPDLNEELSEAGTRAESADAGLHHASVYTASSGAVIFAAGTMQWSWALDDWGRPTFKGVRTPVDRRVQQITRNVLRRLGGAPGP
jgi:hypothetical protein